MTSYKDLVNTAISTEANNHAQQILNAIKGKSTTFKTTSLFNIYSLIESNILTDTTKNTRLEQIIIRSKDHKDGEASTEKIWVYGKTKMKPVFMAPFNEYRGKNENGKPRYHQGVDLSAGGGNEIVAAWPGEVVYASKRSGYGQCVIIKHKNTWKLKGLPLTPYFVTVYGHLVMGSITVKVGQFVEAGTVIGKEGSTGRSTGPHLHFEIRPSIDEGGAVDPTPFLDESKYTR